jgi:hypothetical protein
MGLDTSHDAWQGAYSAFTRFRTALCKAAGYEMDSADGRTPFVDWGHVTAQNLNGEWEFIPCGTRGPDPLLFEDQDLGGHIGDVAAKTQRFIDGCRAAAAAGERLEFF